MNKKIIFSLYSFMLLLHCLQSKITMPLDQEISVITFDKTTGILYGGCAQHNGSETVFKIDPVNNETALTGLAKNDDAYLSNENLTISKIALAHRATDNILKIGNPFLVLHTNANTRQLYIKDVITGENTETTTIKDANNVVGDIKKIIVTEAIKNNNDNNYYNCIFTAIAQANEGFGIGNGGLSFTKISNSLQATNQTTIGLNNRHPWVDANADSTPTLADHVCLKWDSLLQRLFVGIAGTSLNIQPPDNYGLITLSCFKINDEFNQLENIQINTTINSYGTADNTATSTIIGIDDTANNVSISVINIDTMHTSTDKHYVIIHGGLGTLTTANKKIFAVPLVGPDGDEPGALATVLDRATGTIDFTKRTPGATYLYRETDTPAIVGATTLPFTNNNCTVRKVEAVGDTIFVAITGLQGGQDQPGLYFSQALFNETGGIQRWTTWERIISLDNANTSLIDFAIDAGRGRIWTLPDTRQVNITNWIRSTDRTSFCGQINTALQGPCYSHLFIGKHTENFGNYVTSHYALFGGNSKIVVIRTGVSNTASYTAPTLPTLAWNNAANAALDISDGLDDAGIIHQIIYTGTDENTTNNYFFANTEDGLYAFCSNDAGEGVNIRTALADNQLTALNLDTCIFKTGHWEKIETDAKVFKITNSPTEGHVYCIEQLGDNLFLSSIAYGATIDDFQYGLHQSKTFFSDHQITTVYDLKTVKYGTTYGLLIATNKGLLFYDTVSSKFNIVSNKIVTNFSVPKYCRNHESFCSVEKQDDFSTGNATEKYFLQQMILPTITGTITPNSIHYNPHHNYTTNINLLPLSTLQAEKIAGLQYLNSITTPVLNFGSLRFFGQRIFNDNNAHSTLTTLPYKVDILEHNITRINALLDKTIENTKIIHWIDHVGSGYILAGTEDGVISLE